MKLQLILTDNLDISVNSAEGRIQTLEDRATAIEIWIINKILILLS